MPQPLPILRKIQNGGVLLGHVSLHGGKSLVLMVRPVCHLPRVVMAASQDGVCERPGGQAAEGVEFRWVSPS